MWFRLYPLNRTIEILDNEHVGNRMDFDIEILIKAHWYQIPLIWVDTPVSYDKMASHTSMLGKTMC